MTDPTESEESVQHMKVKLGPLISSGFPVRVLTRPDLSGELTSQGICGSSCQFMLVSGGEWITAYQADQRRHLQAVMLSSKLEARGSKVINAPANSREASCSQHPVLDEQFLLENCYVFSPSDLSKANISSKELKDVSMLQ